MEGRKAEGTTTRLGKKKKAKLARNGQLKIQPGREAKHTLLNTTVAHPSNPRPLYRHFPACSLPLALFLPRQHFEVPSVDRDLHRLDLLSELEY